MEKWEEQMVEIASRGQIIYYYTLEIVNNNKIYSYQPLNIRKDVYGMAKTSLKPYPDLFVRNI